MTSQEPKCCEKCDGYFEHRVGSHSDDWGKDGISGVQIVVNIFCAAFLAFMWHTGRQAYVIGILTFVLMTIALKQTNQISSNL